MSVLLLPMLYPTFALLQVSQYVEATPKRMMNQTEHGKSRKVP